MKVDKEIAYFFFNNSKQLNKLKLVFKDKEVSFKANLVAISYNFSSGQMFKFFRSKQKSSGVVVYC